MALSQQLLANPMALLETQAEFWQDYLTLWQRTTQRMLGFAAEPVIEPAKDDRRFRHEQWSENTVFDFIKQSYLLSARCLHDTVKGIARQSKWKRHDNQEEDLGIAARACLSWRDDIASPFLIVVARRSRACFDGRT